MLAYAAKETATIAAARIGQIRQAVRDLGT